MRRGRSPAPRRARGFTLIELLIAAALLKLASGWWSDRLGRRKPLVVAGYAIAAWWKNRNGAKAGTRVMRLTSWSFPLPAGILSRVHLRERRTCPLRTEAAMISFPKSSV